MVLKPEQQRIKALLCETISLLCQSSLHFKSEFSIEALIGITLDQDDVFLVSIKETVRTNDSWTRPESLVDLRTTGCCIGQRMKEESVRDCMGDGANDSPKAQPSLKLESRLLVSQDYNKNLSTFVDFSCQKSVPETVQNSIQKRLRKDPAPKIYPQRHALTYETYEDCIDGPEKERKRPKMTDAVEVDRAVEDSQEPFETQESGDRECSTKLCSFRPCYDRSREFGDLGEKDLGKNDPSKLSDLNTIVCNGARPSRGSDGENVLFTTADAVSENEPDFVKDKCLVIKNDQLVVTTPRRYKPRKPNGKSSPSSRFLGGRKYGARGSTVGIMHPLAIQKTEPNLSALWQLSVATEDASAAATAAAQQWVAEQVEGTAESVKPEEKSSTIADSPPDITVEQASMVVEVLSISGSFINIGSAKAFQHNLRKLTKNELSEVLEKMSVPATSSYCVGLLCTEGASRVFYKIPPPLIKEEALSFYNLDLSVYSNLYYGPVRVPHNVKEPYEWRCMLEMKSPFNFMTAAYE